MSIPLQYDGALQFTEGFAAVKVRDRWGYIDKAGRMTIQPQFNKVSIFSGQLASVQVNRGDSYRGGYIDKMGQFVIEPQFESAGDFSDGFASIIEYGSYSSGYKYKVINKNGANVLDFPFVPAPTGRVVILSLSTLKEGMFYFQIGDDCVYFNKDAKEIFQIYSECPWLCSDFSEGLAPICKRFDTDSSSATSGTVDPQGNNPDKDYGLEIQRDIARDAATDNQRQLQQEQINQRWQEQINRSYEQRR